VSSKIEWTDETWNPVTGCSKVSQGCKNCYAERLWPKVAGAEAKRTGEPPRPFTQIAEHYDRLETPLRWRRPRRVFVNSMSDLFHEDISDEFIADVFAYMAYARQHTFQVLTKRPHRMAALLGRADFSEMYDTSGALAHDAACEILGQRGEFDPNARSKDDIRAMDDTLPRPNVWLGVSVEDQATADERIPLLLQTPAAVRFVSYEPALGPVDFSEFLQDDPLTPDKIAWCGLDWIIAGGESGPGARPAHPDWFRSVRDQCAAAGVPFFFKQWGEHGPCWLDAKDGTPWRIYPDGRRMWGLAESMKPPETWPTLLMQRLGKKAAGRLLDGREHSEYPQ
jgi:protein gp37